MATLEEILTKAKNADAAGDTEAAKRLVEFAKKSFPGAISDAKPTVASPTAATDSESRLLGFDVRGNQPQTPARKPYFGDTAMGMAAEPASAALEYGHGIMYPRDSSIGKEVQKSGWYIPGVSDLGIGALNAGGALLSGLHAGMAGSAGLAGDVTGLFGASESNQQRLANDLMGMAEASAGAMPAGTIAEASAASKASKALEADRKLNGAAAAAKDLGITPSLGMTGKTGAMIAAGLEKVPFSGAVIAKDANRAIGEIAAVANRIAKGGLSPASAGELLRTGLKTWVDKAYSGANRMYDAVARVLPPTSTVRLDNAKAAFDSTKQYFTALPELSKKLGLNEWDKVMAEADANGVPWVAARQLRSKIGQELKSGGSALKDEDRGNLKMLYGALSKDMEASARAAGPQALKLWNKANNEYKSISTRIDRSLDATITAKNPERAFEAFDALTQADRSSADILRMRQIKASLSKDDWAQVSQSIAARLGKAKAGAQNAEGDAFSPAAFVTEWNKMTPEARSILFDEPVRIELEKLAKVSEAFKKAGAERNVSNTASASNLAKIAIGLHLAPTATVSTVAGATIGAKAMTNVWFLRALNNAARGDAKAIEAMAKGRGPFADDAVLVMKALGAGDAANSSAPPRKAMSR